MRRPGRDRRPMMLEAAPRDLRFLHRRCRLPDGVPYWDTGAPGLATLGDWRDRPADPFNDHEPVDSSAAAIAAQGLLRLGRLPRRSAGPRAAAATPGRPARRRHAVRRVGPYLSADPAHQGLLLHSVYHWPNGWDYVPPGAQGPARRVEPVGRLPPARGRALRAAAGAGAPVPTPSSAPRAGMTGAPAHDAGAIAPRSSPAARAASGSASPARWRATAGTSRSAACARRRSVARVARRAAQRWAARCRLRCARTSSVARRARARSSPTVRSALRRASTRSSTTPAALRACAPTCSTPARRASRSWSARTCRARTS